MSPERQTHREHQEPTVQLQLPEQVEVVEHPEHQELMDQLHQEQTVRLVYFMSQCRITGSKKSFLKGRIL